MANYTTHLITTKEDDDYDSYNNSAVCKLDGNSDDTVTERKNKKEFRTR